MRNLATVATIAVFAACATKPRQANLVIPATAWLAKFEPALRFVPEGTRSMWFVDHRAIAETATGILPTHVEIRCEPELSIEDHGGYGIPKERIAALGESRETMLDLPVWSSDGSGSWTACVDDRFLLRTPSKVRLERALRRDGEPARAGFAALPAVDPATTDLVLRSAADSAAAGQWLVDRSATALQRTVEAAK